MTRLEDLTPNTAIRGIIPNQTVTVVSTQWYGSEALELTYKDPTGKVANELLYRYDEPRIELVEFGRPWSFDGDGALFRLVSEANRIRMAHLFDPVLAVHTSLVDPLPHQITAVYESMLPRQPLRYLLADDPGAGKTIMAGLLIKELIVRGDLQRCLVVCPGIRPSRMWTSRSLPLSCFPPRRGKRHTSNQSSRANSTNSPCASVSRRQKPPQRTEQSSAEEHTSNASCRMVPFLASTSIAKLKLEEWAHA